MDFISDIYRRMDLQQIRTFLLNGTENFDTENTNYKSRLINGSNLIYKRLESIYQDENELDKAVADLSKALISYEDVYTEIGMKFGARLVHQLLCMDDNVEPDK